MIPVSRRCSNSISKIQRLEQLEEPVRQRGQQFRSDGGNGP